MTILPTTGILILSPRSRFGARYPAFIVASFASTMTLAQSFSLTSFTVDGGGGVSLAPGWSLQASLGQPAAGSMSAGPWTLALGYWPAAAPPQPPSCVADVDDGSSTGTPDGGVTIDDLLYYLDIFRLGVLRADLDDGSGTGTPDGGVTIEDLLYFLLRYEAGC